MPCLDSYLLGGIEPGIQDFVSIKVNIKNYACPAEITNMFIAWLKSQNMILNQEEEIYFDL